MAPHSSHAVTLTGRGSSFWINLSHPGMLCTLRTFSNKKGVTLLKKKKNEFKVTVTFMAPCFFFTSFLQSPDDLYFCIFKTQAVIQYKKLFNLDGYTCVITHIISYSSPPIHCSKLRRHMSVPFGVMCGLLSVSVCLDGNGA